ncbi:MAG: acyl-CoA thioesterase [Ignavibacteria bacterium]
MFTTVLRVNFYDADPAGVLFFGNIFRLAHSAFEEMLENSGIGKEYFFNEKYAVPLIHTEADYRKPILPNTKVTAEVEVVAIKETSFEMKYTFRNEAGEFCTTVKAVHVFIDLPAWKKTGIPDRLREFLSGI